MYVNESVYLPYNDINLVFLPLEHSHIYTNIHRAILLLVLVSCHLAILSVNFLKSFAHWTFKQLVCCECECCQKQDLACLCNRLQALAAIYANEMEKRAAAQRPACLSSTADSFGSLITSTSAAGCFAVFASWKVECSALTVTTARG